MISYNVIWKGTASFLAVCAAIAVLAGEVSAADADRRVYRYVTPDGKVVVTDSPLPAHAVYGYDIIDPDSDRIIRRVSPQQSANDYQAEQARRRALEECQNELRSLRYRYAAVTDIEVARESNLGAIDHRVTVIRSELVRVESELEDNLRRAAESERAGESVTRQVSGNITQLRESLANFSAELEQKALQRDATVARFARDIERYSDGTCGYLEDAGR